MDAFDFFVQMGLMGQPHSNLSLLYKITAKFLNLFLIDTNSP
ncbi:hypothetical protein EB18_00443 [Enterococcus cecorum]|uniref:Uncharacterized protein n=1 Tax=Enterococcus cecorum TaxID=44008 RepID=A0A366SJJ3_9ENTE|nr:hypothetical protein EB18_00443 [Enterococcus cecorum]CAI3505483.1 hypothetical protein CIRMBP1307_02086 [Enterococcus cecorum]CAI3510695.1 hypothetical protein CIRMBP1308_02162 [Enterococcus cecorum]